jgi:predicted nucleic acid-binding protein
VKGALAGVPARLRGLSGVLVDSNVLLDVASNDPNWADWSASALAECAEHALMVINPIIYAEVSVNYSTIEDLDAAFPVSLLDRQALPWEAGFLAGKCFAAYRRRGGPRSVPIPDFYIGAHAAIARFALLTRDVSRYRTYFPTVELLAPQRLM